MPRKAKTDDDTKFQGQLKKLDEGLGEFTLSQGKVVDRDLVQAMVERLGDVSRLLEFLVVYGRHYGESELRARVSREALREPEGVGASWDEVIEVLSLEKLKDHLRTVYSEVSEVVKLKRRIHKLEQELKDERSQRFHDRMMMGPMMR